MTRIHPSAWPIGRRIRRMRMPSISTKPVSASGMRGQFVGGFQIDHQRDVRRGDVILAENSLAAHLDQAGEHRRRCGNEAAGRNGEHDAVVGDEVARPIGEEQRENQRGLAAAAETPNQHALPRDLDGRGMDGRRRRISQMRENSGGGFAHGTTQAPTEAAGRRTVKRAPCTSLPAPGRAERFSAQMWPRCALDDLLGDGEAEARISWRTPPVPGDRQEAPKSLPTCRRDARSVISTPRRLPRRCADQEVTVLRGASGIVDGIAGDLAEASSRPSTT